jgi:hypothetical protein
VSQVSIKVRGDPDGKKAERLGKALRELLAETADVTVAIWDVTDRDQRIRELADQAHGKDGEVEFDEDAIVSEGEDNGAYVQAWVWVGFSGTDLDQEEEDSEPE